MAVDARVQGREATILQTTLDRIVEMATAVLSLGAKELEVAEQQAAQRGLSWHSRRHSGPGGMQSMRGKAAVRLRW